MRRLGSEKKSRLWSVPLRPQLWRFKLETLPDLWQVTPNQWLHGETPDQEERKDCDWVWRLDFHVIRVSASFPCSIIKGEVVGVEVDVEETWNDDDDE